MNKKYRVMFVCHGNICRSPMAEMVLLSMLSERGLSDDFVVASSATSCEELGNPIYPPARRELARRGIPMREHRATRLEAADYDRYDVLVGMDGRNIRNMHLMLGGDPEGKIIRLLDLTDKPGDVADPWYSGDFATTYEDVVRGCRALIGYLLSE